MTFDRDKAHKDVSISADGKVFMNISDVPSSSRLHK